MHSSTLFVHRYNLVAKFLQNNMYEGFLRRVAGEGITLIAMQNLELYTAEGKQHTINIKENPFAWGSSGYNIRHVVIEPEDNSLWILMRLYYSSSFYIHSSSVFQRNECRLALILYLYSH